MSRHLRLTITTPMTVLLDLPEVRSVRAEDQSGGFGILPGHVDFLTTLPASVLRWRGADGKLHFCALRAGVLTVSGGDHVAVACREGVLGDDLPALQARVSEHRRETRDTDRRARVDQMRVHASAVRQIMYYLNAGKPDAFDHPPSLAPEPDGGAA
jgi:F-type H+-transporting ATPase subunit epsilon